MPLTPEGLTVPRLAELREQCREDIKASSILGPAWQTGPGTIIGQLIDVVMARVAESYELAGYGYEAFQPDNAVSVQLDYVASIIGTVREPATQSSVVLQLNGIVSTVVPAGTLYRIPDGSVWIQDEDVTLTGGADDADAHAQDFGEIEAAAGTITEVVNAIAGLVSVTNGADAIPGRDRETDAELRERREREIVAPSSSTDYGIGSALSQLPTVDYGRAISDRVAHTVRCLVYPNTADTDSIAGVLWDKTPAGIEMLGAQSATVTDANGDSQVVKWDWVSDETLTTVVNISGVANNATNTAAIKAAVIGEVELLGVGDDAYAVQIQSAVVQAMGEGVTSCAVTIDGGSSVVIAEDEIAVVDDTDITVNYV